ncbi:hypothetical protein EXS56_00310 [Candidatus Kaiserbacteria bacterium]|nr:hypothetical protein [Candidatus Kaiserbacteria bacterium]
MKAFVKVLFFVACVLMPMSAQAEPVSFGQDWGNCRFEYPGHVVMDQYPDCKGTSSTSAVCRIYATLNGVEKQWTATVRSRQLKTSFAGKDPAVEFGDGSLQCSINSANVTAIRHCWAKKSGAGGSGGCNICGMKSGKEQCAVITVHISQAAANKQRKLRNAKK